LAKRALALSLSVEKMFQNGNKEHRSYPIYIFGKYLVLNNRHF